MRSPGSVAGLVLALGLVVGAGASVVLVAEWIATAPTISPESDLATPLFSGETLRHDGLAAQEASGVPILCYHYFRPGLTSARMLRVLGAVLLNMPTIPDKEYWTTTVPEFERQMRYLAENGYRTISLDELCDYLEGRAEISPRSVVLTIDDGDRSFVEHAVPVLRRYGFTATVFLLTGRAGGNDWNRLDIVDWETLRRLEEEGVVRVESHTHRMHAKVKAAGEWVPRFLQECRDEEGRVSPSSALGRDLLASRNAIRRHLGHDCRFIAWPFGFGSAEVDSLAQTMGMRRVLTLRPNRNALDHRAEPEPLDGVNLGRYTITARTSFRVFRMMVRPAATTVGG